MKETEEIYKKALFQVFENNSPEDPDLAIKICELYHQERLKSSAPKQKVITVSIIRDLINQYDKEEISISRFAEILNEIKVYNSLPSEQEIEEKVKKLNPEPDGLCKTYYYLGLKDALTLLTKGDR